MRFAEPMHFLLLILVAALGLTALWAIGYKKRILNRFGELPLIFRNSPTISFARQRVKVILLVLATSLVAVALARLQFGTHKELVKREGIDIVVCLDVSTSMLAQDIKPSRLAKAKQEVHAVIDRLRGDRIGLVAFAGEAFTQCPLTLDYAAARLMLGAMDDKAVSIQGTSLASAMTEAIELFDRRERKHKVVLLLTDGEGHDENAEEVAAQAREEGVRIYTVGVGTPSGEPIPVLDRRGVQVGFKKDEGGEVIVSQLNDQILQKIALTTGGKFFQVTVGEVELDRIFAEISEMDKKELEGTLVTRFDDRFQWPLMLALMLLIAEFFVSERRRPDVGTRPAR